MTNPSFEPAFKIELTPRGEIPLTPKLPPLPQFMTLVPFGLDENGKHITDIRGNAIKTEAFGPVSQTTVLFFYLILVNINGRGILHGV